MERSSSCSHWWHAPVYFSISIILAVFAATTQFPSSSSSTTTTDTHLLSLNASRALFSLSNFTLLASLLHLSPDLLLSSPQSTIFALPDAAFHRLSLSPSSLKLLLQYHTLPYKLSFQDLLSKPVYSCFPTLVRHKNISITGIEPRNSSVEINGVPVSHPDLFLSGSISIHGVLGPFFTINLQEINPGQDFIPSPNCNFTPFYPNPVPETRSEWVQIIRVLSSKGFVSFTIGLNFVLDRVLMDYPDLSTVTLFAPPELGFVTAPSPVLERVVRYHILPERYAHSELVQLPEKAQLRTLLPEKDLVVTNSVNGSRILGINGVDVSSPDLFSTKMFIVHGISRAFDFEQFANS